MLLLVSRKDEPVGEEEKMTVHAKGLLHRAFSVFLFNPEGDMLLQQRARHKYHSPGLWSNACCGHPRPDEETRVGAERRLMEELGIQCELEYLGKFRYRAVMENGLIEHEVDHVFVGGYDGEITPNPDEVGAWRWMAIDRLRDDLDDRPSEYTAWFDIAVRQFGLLQNGTE